MTDTRPWSVYLTLVLGCFITIEAAAFQAPALPSIARHFGVGENVTALIVLLYYLGLVVFSPICGRFADRFGRKRVIVGGLALFSVAEFMAAMSPTYPLLLAARFFQGFAVACILPVVLSYVAHLFPVERRGMPLGFLAFGIALGATSGALIGGYIIDRFGWRSIYWVSGAMALLGLALVVWRTPETPRSRCCGASSSTRHRRCWISESCAAGTSSSRHSSTCCSWSATAGRSTPWRSS